jgi:tryptophan synthase alpha chain
MNRIDAKFIELADKKEHALIGYMVAGYPDYETSIDVALAMVDGGVDILEIGIPFSDPIADGPTIQRASYVALSKGITPLKALRIASIVNDECKRIGKNVPLIAMTYYNIIYKRGISNFLEDARSNSIDGIIVPDLIYEEASSLVDNALRYGIDTIFLATPNTSTSRLDTLTRISKGFLYLVSVYGITGVRDRFEEYTIDAIRRVKGLTLGKIPLAVGFGISKREHVRIMLNAGADAVVVGSAFISLIEHNSSSNNKDLIDAIKSLAREMKEETRL